MKRRLPPFEPPGRLEREVRVGLAALAPYVQSTLERDGIEPIAADALIDYVYEKTMAAFARHLGQSYAGKAENAALQRFHDCVIDASKRGVPLEWSP